MQTLSNCYNKAKAGALVGTQQYSPDLVALSERMTAHIIQPCSQ